MASTSRLFPGLLLSSFFSCLTLLGCARENDASSLTCQSTGLSCLKGVAQISLETSRGTVLLNVDGNNAPLTAGNFVDLVRKGVYNQTIFHRVIRSPIPFVVQGGDPASSDPRTPVAAYGTGQYIDAKTGQERLIPLEIRLKSSKKFVYGQEVPSADVGQKPALSHDRGAIAMARSSDPNSASAQFYIALEALPELDGRYAVFGKVVQGMDVVDKLQQGDKLIRARVVGPE